MSGEVSKVYDVNIKIDPKITFDGYYTKGDFVSGTIILDVRESCNIHKVDVVLEGIKTFHITVPPSLLNYTERTNWVGDRIQYQLSKGYDKIENVNTVFFAVSQTVLVSKEKSMLSEGQYEFPFEFQFPLDTDLFPSSDIGIKYEVKTVLQGTANGNNGDPIELPFAVPGGTFNPSNRKPSMVRSPFVLKDINTGGLSITLIFEARFPDAKIFTVGRKFPPIELYLLTNLAPSHFSSINGTVMIKNLKLLINQVFMLETDFLKRRSFTEDISLVDTDEHIIFADLANSQEIPKEYNDGIPLYQVPIQVKLFRRAIFRETFHPSFRSDDISCSYKLKLEANIAIMNHSEFTKTSLQTDVEVAAQIETTPKTTKSYPYQYRNRVSTPEPKPRRSSYGHQLQNYHSSGGSVGAAADLGIGQVINQLQAPPMSGQVVSGTQVIINNPSPIEYPVVHTNIAPVTTSIESASPRQPPATLSDSGKH